MSTDSQGPAAIPFEIARKEPKLCTQMENVLLLDSIKYVVWNTLHAWECLHFYTNIA
jgi:hypothetical protein